MCVRSNDIADMVGDGHIAVTCHTKHLHRLDSVEIREWTLCCCYGLMDDHLRALCTTECQVITFGPDVHVVDSSILMSALLDVIMMHVSLRTCTGHLLLLDLIR